MRSIIIAALIGLGSLGLLTPTAQASWLSELLRGQRRDPGPYYGQYVPPNTPNYGAYYQPYQPGPYYPQQPAVQDWAANVSGTWYMSGNPYVPCQIIQGRNGHRAEFINERGERSGGRVYADRVWAADWSDGRSDGLWGSIQGNRIVWSNGSFWAR